MHTGGGWDSNPPMKTSQKTSRVPRYVPRFGFATPVFGQKTTSLNLASHPGKLSTKSTDSISGEEKPAQGRLSDQDAAPHPAAKPFLKLSQVQRRKTQLLGKAQCFE